VAVMDANIAGNMGNEYVIDKCHHTSVNHVGIIPNSNIQVKQRSRDMQELIARKFQGSSVEVIVKNEEPLFEIYSTGMALGHSVTNAKGAAYPNKDRINKSLESAEITPCLHDANSYINEEQLYDLMLEMRTDKCKPFRKWVTKEVLPTIRKTGGYVANEEMFINTYFPELDDTAKMILKQSLANKLALLSENKRLAVEAKEAEPKVEYFDALVDAPNSTTLRETAKLLGIGERDFIDLLLDGNYIYRNKKGKLEPMARYMSQSSPYLDVKETKGFLSTLVTMKGREYFLGVVKAIAPSGTAEE